jgi:peptidoglycan/xylan/chitin deacetylase (PgdA/CDA1 family)
MDFYTSAFPILIDYGFTASVFVVSEFAQTEPRVSEHAPYMGWTEIRRVHQHGIEIGSHSATHSKLSELSPARIDEELELSKRAIEDALGSEIQSFSYPYGFPKHDRTFAARIRCQLKAYGYRNAVTTLLGTAGRGCDEFALPRLPINSHDDLSLFKAKLEGAYDWLYIFQSLWKNLKADLT